MALIEEQVVDKVLASSKYKYVDRATVERIVASCVQRYGLKRAEDAAKRLLHQVWGIYYADLSSKVPTMDDLDRVLALHLSTKERLPYLREFYEAIFKITGEPVSIDDYGCGLNPLAYASLGLSFPRQYRAFDIDELTIHLLNAWFAKLAISDRFVAAPGDLLRDALVSADVTLLLKVLPPLELQESGASQRVLESIPSRFIVVSYPTKSVSGKEKGMADFYRQQFKKVTDGKDWRITELTVGSELIFVIEKPMPSE